MFEKLFLSHLFFWFSFFVAEILKNDSLFHQYSPMSNVLINSRWANFVPNHNPAFGRLQQRVTRNGKTFMEPVYSPEEKVVYDVYHVDDMAQPPRYFSSKFHPFHPNSHDTGRVWRYEVGGMGPVGNRRRFFFPDEFLSQQHYEEWAGRLIHGFLYLLFTFRTLKFLQRIMGVFRVDNLCQVLHFLMKS